MDGRELLVRGGAGVVGTGLLVAAMWVHTMRPKVDAKELDPLRNDGRIGQTVSNRMFSVRVDGVQAARSLAPGLSFGNEPAIGTDGIYLAVRIRARSEREPLRLGTAVLETPGGYSYRYDPRSGTTSTVPDMQPLIWAPGTLLFELPKDRLRGAHLVVGTGGLLPQLSAAADIDLGIDANRAEALLRSAADRFDPEAGS
ncbi:hypothetical protein GCM10009527_022970 [Actinomadura nitritigenes]|uniref:DUF4352 domain-containing protein n=1 Tax=Actinomadura nitritigenes TaxID=134602 RepID=A0ABS3RFW6_9ACTN|nr:hypothetical protein [Actinomadura nitritigenes]MBO2444757.1 hypothetical protein [Actinomadura nitritigenes]